MDAFYNKTKAGFPLMQQKSVWQKTTERFGLSIRREDTNGISKLTQCNEEMGETEEAMVGIQGIICSINLSPFKTGSSQYTLGNNTDPGNRQAVSLAVVDINTEIDPRRSLLKVGNLVELQVSLMCIPIRGSFTVKLILWSKVLLNSKLTTKAMTARTLLSPAPVLVLKHLKRCNPYAGNLGTCKSHFTAHHARINVNIDDDEGASLVEGTSTDTGATSKGFEAEDKVTFMEE
ncbi:hypothetical protein BDN71DRAFT_1430638 [Pleurotus eryngii]|uniref:Uncharacterized protein n=1 Tax=Pleurotus eryngii TaxID=5323 RepID=A0A9P5ZYF8_PLEER|nr:hypothetical protein BDN71DRAFT_1430638 [Pleurotus eryngii]